MSSVVGHLYYQSVHDQVTRTRRLSEGDTMEDDTDESLEALVSRLSVLSQAPVFRTRQTLVTQDIEDLIQAFSRSIVTSLVSSSISLSEMAKTSSLLKGTVI